MKAFLKFFLCLAVMAVVLPARALTIVPTFDSSITSLSNASAVTNALLFAIQTLQSNITDNITVKIDFVSDASAGLGESSTWLNNFSYSSYLTALKKHAKSINDTNALSRIPNSSTDPLTGNNMIQLNLPLARLMGLYSSYGQDGYDSTITLNMTIISPTRPPAYNQYDLIPVAEHEMDEVLGTSSALPDNYPGGPICPADLFRYTTNLVRTFTTSGDNAYFSADGTNLLTRYNQDGYGDYGDWWSADAYWAPPGVTPRPQVQDAYGEPGIIVNEGTNELALLDVIGFTLAAAPATPTGLPVIRIIHNGLNQFTLSWSNSYTGFILQERTNLLTGAWTASVTGSTNPAAITSTNGQKFYRLYENTPSAMILTEASQEVQSSTNLLQRRILQIRLPDNP